MFIRAPKDFWSGVVFLVAGLSFALTAYGYSIGNMHRMGPGMFPMLVGLVMAGLGAILTARSFVIDGLAVPKFHARPVAISLLAMAGFGLLLRPAGLVAAVSALVAVASFASERVRIVETLVLAAVLAGGSVVLFVWVIGLPMSLWPAW